MTISLPTQKKNFLPIEINLHRLAWLIVTHLTFMTYYKIRYSILGLSEYSIISYQIIWWVIPYCKISQTCYSENLENISSKNILFRLPPIGDFPCSVFDIVLKRITIRGSIVGTRKDMQEALSFASRGIISMIAIYIDDLTDYATDSLAAW